jgi:hypothetical protein
MFCGIGLLGGCLLMLLFFSIVHERAVRLTKQCLIEATPLTVNEIQADKDARRAQLAMSVRRLEISMEEVRARTAGRHGEIGKHNAELSRLLVDLDKKAALILAAGAGRGAKKHRQKDRENPPVYLHALEAPAPAGNVFAPAISATGSEPASAERACGHRGAESERRQAASRSY